MRFQGAKLKHLTAFLDAPHVPAVIYRAMSRVGYGHACLLGSRPTADHFTPMHDYVMNGKGKEKQMGRRVCSLPAALIKAEPP